MNHILHKVIFQNLKGIPQSLYFTGTGLSTERNTLEVESGGELDLTSYFNLFSWNKWEQYTGISSLDLVLHMDGCCDCIIHSLGDDGSLLAEYKYILTEKSEHILEIPKKLLAGHISVVFQAETNLVFHSAHWASNSIIQKRDIRIAAVFCTYHRDKYLFPNLETLKNCPANNVDVIIIDNASRLKESKIKTFGDNFHIFHNPNTGGSGGFTRGIMEALNSKKDYTHVLLMDDDIKLDGDTIVRSEILLSLLKPEYQEHFLAGAMLVLDEPEIMFELTASWAGYRAVVNNNNLNLADKNQLCHADNAFSAPTQYAGWWFCGIPLSKGIEDDLPFPFFIYGDDMDYSIKRASGFLTLNGIGVWHESFDKKFAPLFKSYFFCRNILILNSLHNNQFSFRHSAINGMIHFWAQILVHDYRSAVLALDAVEDFLKGAEYITGLDEFEILKSKQITLYFHKLADIDLNGCFQIRKKIKCWSSLWYFCHRKLAVYNHNKDAVEIRRRSWKSIIRLFFRSFILGIKFIINFRRVGKSYRDIERNRDYWQKRFRSLKEG
jgi:galactofuranosylgalactofuranosylrhamnosyl-N-acetylglucosaminyl-diphospho-decaprenol beta-1,5/1,6-galactofuranosyltransferase